MKKALSIFLLFTILILSACSNTAIQQKSEKEGEEPTETELTWLEILEVYSQENLSAQNFFETYSKYIDQFTSTTARNMANEMYNKVVQHLITSKDNKRLYFLYTEGFIKHKEVLSKDLVKSVNQIVADVKIEEDAKKEKIKRILSIIENKNFDSLHSYIDDTLDKETLDSLLSYGYAIEELQKNGETNHFFDLLLSISPLYKGEKNKEIEAFVTKYLALDEWKEKYIVKINNRIMNQEYKGDQVKNIPLTAGMSKQEVVYSAWGKPLQIKIFPTDQGVSEQWIYSDIKHLTFDNNELTGWQE
ncbi:hypothetical protein [Heyndrickxia oleronia]|uniref:Lipoprotein n=1 Tax=Heyndrickxia oleronia TaxID=38875 RepID=A0A8E2LBK2_9BACI|nr:hypothetical protein [Heyndrickxia oleronia]NYV65548.1 hypothetical protein [Bacillus sp. Gen3]OJH20524.1 hypothetical protein BLX88_01670 [Bacillus obstructivus]MEC1376525.1 hypothetical protein [Heyndrickxia oleronia]OOP66025.1 hypothetical protein BWZ43_23160 [Heyndrickxia oleronia]QQZ07005.1 hypothetical protein I5818_11660 [Heyndrickxia oleronia]